MLLYDKQREADRLQRRRYLEEVSHPSCSHDRREAHRGIIKVPAPACSGNQARTFYGTSSVRSEVGLLVSTKKPGVYQAFSVDSNLTHQERNASCLGASEPVEANSRNFLARKYQHPTHDASELFFIHTLCVGACLSVDTDEITFVDEHRHLDSCPCL